MSDEGQAQRGERKPTLGKDLARHAGQLVGESVQQILELGRQFAAGVVVGLRDR